jgi:hypothetical protein
MTDMTEQNKFQKETNDISSETNSLSTNSRRSFLTKAVIAAPIVSVLASKPAWAVEQCTTSGMLSGNLSTNDEECSFGGLSPGYWKKAGRAWPFTSPIKTNTFEQLFDNGALNSGDDGFGVTLITVLGTGGGVNHDTLVGLNRHMVATACNFAYASFIASQFPTVPAIFTVPALGGTPEFTTWAAVKSAYINALTQFQTEFEGGPPSNPHRKYTLATSLANALAASYHQYEPGESSGL